MSAGSTLSAKIPAVPVSHVHAGHPDAPSEMTCVRCRGLMLFETASVDELLSVIRIAVPVIDKGLGVPSSAEHRATAGTLWLCAVCWRRVLVTHGPLEVAR